VLDTQKMDDVHRKISVSNETGKGRESVWQGLYSEI